MSSKQRQTDTSERRFEILDTVTDKAFCVATRELYEKFLSKDSGRFIKAG